MSDKQVVVYGANGYTGRLICEFLRHYEIPFIAAGRNAEKISAAMELVPGIETADYEVVEVAHNIEDLTELFKGASIVCNTVGPFLYFGEVVVEACLNASAHYLDTTGEGPFIATIKDKYGKQFDEAGLLLSPSTAYMHTMSEIAARHVMRTPGVDSVECISSPTGVPTYGSTQTIFSVCVSADRACYIENGKRTVWPAGVGYELPVPGFSTNLLAHNWTGSSLPMFLEDDPSIRNVKQYTAFSDRSMMEKVIGLQRLYESEIKHLPEDEQKEKLSQMAQGTQAGMPPRENALINRCVDVAYGRGGNQVVTCTIHSFNAYQVTGLLQAAAAHYLLKSQPLKKGFASTCEAFGTDKVWGEIQKFGYAQMEQS